MTDPPLKQGWKLHDPPPSYNMDVWFPLNNPIKPCSLFDKICWYTAATNIKITEIIPFTEKSNVKKWKTEHFLFRWTLWVLTEVYSKTRVYWNCLSQSIWKFLHRKPTPTHYLPEMLRLILKENFFHFNGKDYLQNHGTAMGTKTADLIPLPIFSSHIWNNNSKQTCL